MVGPRQRTGHCVRCGPRLATPTARLSPSRLLSTGRAEHQPPRPRARATGATTPHPLLFIDRFAFCLSRCGPLWRILGHLLTPPARSLVAHRIGITRMAGRGFAPSGNAQKKSRNVPRDLVKSDGKIGGFALPSGVLGIDDDGAPIAWHPQTVAWWDAWRASPQGTRMVTEVDWHFLLDTALMHHQFWMRGRWEFGAELRLRVGKFGATPEDRARLRIEIDAPDTPAANAPQKGTAHDRRRERWNIVPDTPTTQPKDQL